MNKETGTVIDWKDIIARIEANRKAIDSDVEVGEQERKKTLRVRARELARPLDVPSMGDLLEVVVFRLADEMYAFETLHVREVYSQKSVTPLPCVPPFVLGIVNVRGQILSVIDLKRFFDLPIGELNRERRILILRSPSMEFAILADEIFGTRMIDRQQIQPSLPTLTDMRGDYLLGVDADRVVVLDAGKLLADSNLVIYEEV